MPGRTGSAPRKEQSECLGFGCFLGLTILLVVEAVHFIPGQGRAKFSGPLYSAKEVETSIESPAEDSLGVG